jgi:hypothetical protein
VSSDAVLLKIDRVGQRLQRRGAVQGTVRPVLVLVSLVLAQDPPQMVLVPDQGAVQASLAGAYALGYAALGMAQQQGDEPEWYHELDPLDTLFLGSAWPQGFRDGYEFANARTAWLKAAARHGLLAGNRALRA